MAFDYTKTKKISDFANAPSLSGSNEFVIDTGSDYKAVTYTVLASNFAASANGVTNGNSHDHNGGDGAQINHTTLSNKGTNSHAQIDSHIASTSNPHSVDHTDVGSTVARWNANKLQGRNVQDTAPSNGEVLTWSTSQSRWEPSEVSSTDEKSKVSSNDTTSGYLNGKLVAGDNVTLTENNNGGNETLTIASTDSTGTDETAKVSSNDTTAGYLNGKLVAGSNITLTENSDGDDETLTIASTASGGSGADEKSKVSSNDTTAGYLNGKLVAGSNITLIENSDGGNETLTIATTASGGSGADEKAKVSANDTTSGYLNGKLVAGSNITLTENSDGSNETLTIASTASGGSGADEKAKVSSNDTTSGYLNGKLVAGSNITLTENGDGGDETLTIASTASGGSGADEKSKVSSNDTTSGYLNGKLVAGSNITLTENNNGGNETLTITSTDSTGTDEKSKVSANDTTAGYLNGKLVAGDNVTLTENNNGDNETLTITSTDSTGTDETAKVSSNDTTPGYLNGKLVAGSNITLTENSDGSDETLTIASAGGSGSSENWSSVTGSSVSMANNNSYILLSGTQTTATLPASGSTGSKYRIVGYGSGGWKVAQNAGQTIIFGNTQTTTGTGGYLESTNQHDVIELACVSGTNVFSVISSIGNITVV